MVRNLSFSLLALLCLAGITRAEDGKLEVGGVGGASARYHTADYTRELWVGLGAEGVDSAELLKALRGACDDTTAVAVIDAKVDRSVSGDADERKALQSISTKQALRGLTEKLALNRADTRVILVALFETANLALRVAADNGALVDGVVLIDPPCGDLGGLQIPKGRNAGVDVLLHPRSDAEFDRDEAALVEGLGAWGAGVRVLRGADRLAGLDARVKDAWQQLRGYTLLEGNKAGNAYELTGQLKNFNVVFVGELHGNPGAHRVQLEVLRRMAKDGGPLALATEQFERDTQQVLDDYLAGRITEAEFRKKGRLWPNYADYRPLVEFCKANKIPVIAGNIPRPLANRVYKEGVEVLEKFTEEEKSWSAPEVRALPGAYRDKFFEAMGGSDGHNDALDRMYASQCFKDDTMAESVAKWLKDNPKGRVLHLNGNFHSKGGLGVPEKLEAMAPGVKMAMVTCIQPGEEEDAAADEWLIRVPGMRPMRRAPQGGSGH
ncbi:MAG: hypothetical protein ICCCNLDF_02754 [Planctomycetes bacterium]|nr:hypothetical protein [Planctomycetota bacterium]